MLVGKGLGGGEKEEAVHDHRRGAGTWGGEGGGGLQPRGQASFEDPGGGGFRPGPAQGGSGGPSPRGERSPGDPKIGAKYSCKELG